MNKVKGDMYGFVTHTWNTLLGRCRHNCNYCYNLGKPWFEGKLRFNEKNLKDKLGSGNFIFVGSSNDLFADNVPKEWIIKTLNHCVKFDNTYLFQTKNPKRLMEVAEYFPKNSILGATVETNELGYTISKAPLPYERLQEMFCIEPQFKTMISIEPILDCDPVFFSRLIKLVSPDFVSIGADSKGHKLPEPSKEKVEKLIEELKKFTEVRIKKNLARIMNSH